MEGKREGEWKGEEGKEKVGERKGNLPPLKFRSGYATGLNPFNTSCSKLLLFEEYSAILV